jgi:hypothetical protein
MAFPLGTLLGAAAVMAVAAWLLRRMASGGGDETIQMPSPGEGAARGEERAGSYAEVVEEPDEDQDEGAAGEHAPDEILFVTSNGELFLPVRAGVRVLQLGEAFSAVTSGLVSWDDVRRQVLGRRHEGGGLPGIGLDVGDFTAGRVTRGAPDVDPWRLELLGRDGEYQPYAFETEDAARGALEVIERRGVIRRPADDEGKPVPVPPGEFEEARRRFEDTLEELATMPDVEPPGDDLRR